MYIHVLRSSLVRTRTTVLDHGCSGKGRLATRTTTQRFSKPMPRSTSAPLTKLWLLFVLCTQMAVYKPFDTRIVHAWAYVSIFLHEFIWTAATVFFAQVRTGFFDTYCTYVHM